MKRLGLALSLGLIALVGVSVPVAAQQAPATPPSQQAEAAPAHVVDGPVELRLGQRLRCPVCQGMSIGDSPSPMAQDMMKQVRRMRAEGQDEDQIVDYFTQRYGRWVLLDPPTQGFALSAWLLPPLLLALGLGYVFLRGRAAEPTRDVATNHASPLQAEDAALLDAARKQLETEP